MHVTLQTLSVNPAKVHERFCPVHGFRHQPRTWRCDPATSSEGAGRFPLQRWFVLVDFLPAVWGRCTRARFSNSAPPRPLWSANISSQVTRPPSPVDIRDVTRRGLTSRRRGNQTGVDVDADRPELWFGVAPGFLAPARSVGALSRMGPGGTHPTRLPSYESCDPAPAQFAPLFLSGFAPGARERLRPPWLNA